MLIGVAQPHVRQMLSRVADTSYLVHSKCLAKCSITSVALRASGGHYIRSLLSLSISEYQVDYLRPSPILKNNPVADSISDLTLQSVY
jgi:hypothetical protein